MNTSTRKSSAMYATKVLPYQQKMKRLLDWLEDFTIG